MNGCEFCGNQEAEHWVVLNEISRLFCSDAHSEKFNNIMKTLKFKAGWLTVDMLLTKQTTEGWTCKAFRGMADLEFNVSFDKDYNILTFEPIFEDSN